MSEFLKEINKLDIKDQIDLLIKYLSVLQDGRAKPDTSGNGGWIRECVYNVDEINEVKTRLNAILGIYIPLKTPSIIDKSIKGIRDYRSNNK